MKSSYNNDTIDFNSQAMDAFYNQTGVHIRKHGKIPDIGPQPLYKKKEKYFPTKNQFMWRNRAKTEKQGTLEGRHSYTYKNNNTQPKSHESNEMSRHQGNMLKRHCLQAAFPSIKFDPKMFGNTQNFYEKSTKYNNIDDNDSQSNEYNSHKDLFSNYSTKNNKGGRWGTGNQATSNKILKGSTKPNNKTSYSKFNNTKVDSRIRGISNNTNENFDDNDENIEEDRRNQKVWTPNFPPQYKNMAMGDTDSSKKNVKMNKTSTSGMTWKSKAKSYSKIKDWCLRRSTDKGQNDGFNEATRNPGHNQGWLKNKKKPEFLAEGNKANTSEEIDVKDRINIEDYDFQDGAKAYKIYDIEEEEDDPFQLSTIPTEKIMKCMKIFKQGYKQSVQDIQTDCRDECHFQLTQDLGEFCETGNVELCSNYINLVDQAIDSGQFEDEGSLNIAMFNIFRLANYSITVPIFEEEDYMRSFFAICEKVFESKQAKRSMICLALNVFMLDAGKQLNYLNDFCVTNLMNGYLNHLFVMCYDLAESNFEEWNDKLVHIGFFKLSIVNLLDCFFTTSRVHILLTKNNEFQKVFQKLYSAVLTLIMRSEFITYFTVDTWKFILDCFTINFLFCKNQLMLKQCESVWDMVSDKITIQNILIRFVNALENFPLNLLFQKEFHNQIIQNFEFIKRHFANERLYTAKQSPCFKGVITKKIFVGLFNLLKNNFNGENEQPFVIDIILGWVLIMKEFLGVTIKCLEDGKKALPLKPYQSSFNEMLLVLQTGKINRGCQDKISRLCAVLLENIELLNHIDDKGNIVEYVPGLNNIDIVGYEYGSNIA